MWYLHPYLCYVENRICCQEDATSVSLYTSPYPSRVFLSDQQRQALQRLTYDYDCVWRSRASLAIYRRNIDEFENQNSQAKSIRRSPRLKELT